MRPHVARITMVAGLAALVCGLSLQAMQTRTAIDVASLGPQVGEQVPDFSLPDQNGRVLTRDDLLGPNGALLLFHRSADW